MCHCRWYPYGIVGLILVAQTAAGELSLWRTERIGASSDPQSAPADGQALRLRAIDIDGRLNDWPRQARPVVLDRAEQVDGDSGRYPKTWSGRPDVSATVRLGWDTRCLYLSADVADDVVRQRATLGKLWDGDSIVLGLDPLGNASAARPHTEDDKEIYLTLHEKLGPIAIDDATRKPLPGATVAGRKRAGGYVIEAALPLSSLGMAAADGLSCGFVILINDDDGDGQEGWIQTANALYAGGTATSMGRLTMAVPGKPDKLSAWFGPMPTAIGGRDLVEARLFVESPRKVDGADCRVSIVDKSARALAGLRSPGSLTSGTNHLTVRWRPEAKRVDGCRIRVTIAAGGQTASATSNAFNVAVDDPFTRLGTYRKQFGRKALQSRLSAKDPGPGKAFRFAVLGDNRDGDQVYRMMLRKIEQVGVDFSLIVGDLVHRGTPDEWHQWARVTGSPKTPIIPVLGNHDLGHNRDEWRAAFGPFDQTAYTDWWFDYGGCRFVIADNGSGENFTDAQLRWLDGVLARAKGHKFVFIHKPPATVDKWRYHAFEPNVDEFCAMMSKHKVDHVFCGHIHAYSTATYRGVRYTVSGGAGVGMTRNFGDQGDDHHFVEVSVSPQGVTQRVIALDWQDRKAGNPVVLSGR